MAMKRMMFAAAASCALMVAPAFAQAPGPAPGNTGAAPAATSLPAAEFVDKAAVSDMFEIQSSELALQKHARPDAKFANKMIHDHTETSKQVKALIDSGKVRATVPTALDSEHQAMLDKLKGLSGKEFDQAYAGMQRQGHTDAVAMFADYARSGDNPALKRWAAKTLPHLKTHLKMAEKLKS
jgi:putative membrane protein